MKKPFLIGMVVMFLAGLFSPCLPFFPPLPIAQASNTWDNYIQPLTPCPTAAVSEGWTNCYVLKPGVSASSLPSTAIYPKVAGIILFNKQSDGTYAGSYSFKPDGTLDTGNSSNGGSAFNKGNGGLPVVSSFIKSLMTQAASICGSTTSTKASTDSACAGGNGADSYATVDDKYTRATKSGVSQPYDYSDDSSGTGKSKWRADYTYAYSSVQSLNDSWYSVLNCALSMAGDTGAQSDCAAEGASVDKLTAYNQVLLVNTVKVFDYLTMLIKKNPPPDWYADLSSSANTNMDQSATSHIYKPSNFDAIAKGLDPSAAAGANSVAIQQGQPYLSIDTFLADYASLWNGVLKPFNSAAKYNEAGFAKAMATFSQAAALSGGADTGAAVPVAPAAGGEGNRCGKGGVAVIQAERNLVWALCGVVSIWTDLNVLILNTAVGFLGDTGQLGIGKPTGTAANTFFGFVLDAGGAGGPLSGGVLSQVATPYQDIMVTPTNDLGKIARTGYDDVTRLLLSLVVLVFVLIALANVLQIQMNNYQIKKIVPGVIIGLMLAFASFFIIRATLEISFQLTSGILSGFNSQSAAGTPDDLSNAITRMQYPGGKVNFNMTHASDPVGTVVSNPDPTAPSPALVIQQVFLNIFGLIGAGMLFALAFMLFLRPIIFTMAIPLAPIAFFGIYFQPLNFLWKRWWKLISGWIFMPVVASFWIWLALLYLHSISTGAGLLASLIGYCVAVGCMYAAMRTPFTLAGEAKVLTESWKNAGIRNVAPASATVRAANQYKNWDKKRNAAALEGPMFQGALASMGGNRLNRMASRATQKIDVKTDQKKTSQKRVDAAAKRQLADGQVRMLADSTTGHLLRIDRLMQRYDTANTAREQRIADGTATDADRRRQAFNVFIQQKGISQLMRDNVMEGALADTEAKTADLEIGNSAGNRDGQVDRLRREKARLQHQEKVDKSYTERSTLQSQLLRQSEDTATLYGGRRRQLAETTNKAMIKNAVDTQIPLLKRQAEANSLKSENEVLQMSLNENLRLEGVTANAITNETARNAMADASNQKIVATELDEGNRQLAENYRMDNATMQEQIAAARAHTANLKELASTREDAAKSQSEIQRRENQLIQNEITAQRARGGNLKELAGAHEEAAKQLSETLRFQNAPIQGEISTVKARAENLKDIATQDQNRFNSLTQEKKLDDADARVRVRDLRQDAEFRQRIAAEKKARDEKYYIDGNITEALGEFHALVAKARDGSGLDAAGMDQLARISDTLIQDGIINATDQSDLLGRFTQNAANPAQFDLNPAQDLNTIGYIQGVNDFVDAEKKKGFKRKENLARAKGADDWLNKVVNDGQLKVATEIVQEEGAKYQAKQSIDALLKNGRALKAADPEKYNLELAKLHNNFRTLARREEDPQEKARMNTVLDDIERDGNLEKLLDDRRAEFGGITAHQFLQQRLHDEDIREIQENRKGMEDGTINRMQNTTMNAGMRDKQAGQVDGVGASNINERILEPGRANPNLIGQMAQAMAGNVSGMEYGNANWFLRSFIAMYKGMAIGNKALGANAGTMAELFERIVDIDTNHPDSVSPALRPFMHKIASDITSLVRVQNPDTRSDEDINVITLLQWLAGPPQSGLQHALTDPQTKTYLNIFNNHPIVKKNGFFVATNDSGRYVNENPEHK